MLETGLDLELTLSGFKLDKKDFLPIIASSKNAFIQGYHNTVLLPVDLTLSSPLQFAKVMEDAEKFKSEKTKIVWDLKFGFFQERVSLHMESFQNAFLRALECFLEEVHPKFVEETIGVILFRGDADLSTHFSYNDYHILQFTEFLEDIFPSVSAMLETPSVFTGFDSLNFEMLDTSCFTKHLKNLYCHHFFSNYLHKIAALLPDGVLPFVFYDTKSIEKSSFLSQIFSKKRYTHLHLILENQNIPLADISLEPSLKASGYLLDKKVKLQAFEMPTIGLILPNDKELLYSTHLQINEALDKLAEKGVSYRIVPEFLVTESWEGLDALIFLKRSLSSNGKRILQGFCVTGGNLIYLDEPLHLENETSFEKYFLTN